MHFSKWVYSFLMKKMPRLRFVTALCVPVVLSACSTPPFEPPSYTGRTEYNPSGSSNSMVAVATTAAPGHMAAPANPADPTEPAEYQLGPNESLISYTVVPGDSIWKISRDQESSIFGIKATNKLTSDMIRPGQVLQVPTRRKVTTIPGQAAPTSQANSPARTYLPDLPAAAPPSGEIPSPAPSATNPVIQGAQIPASSLGRGVPGQAGTINNTLPSGFQLNQGNP